MNQRENRLGVSNVDRHQKGARASVAISVTAFVAEFCGISAWLCLGRFGRSFVRRGRRKLMDIGGHPRRIAQSHGNGAWNGSGDSSWNDAWTMPGTVP